MLLSHYEPKNGKQAFHDENWKAAMQSKYEALIKQQTWDLVPLPHGRKIIGYKWVFRVKENVNGSINKYKAHFVAKGFHQDHGFNFHETLCPVIKRVTMCLILTIVVSHRWKLFHLDVNKAFLNGLMDETIYMHQPSGLKPLI